MNEDDQKSPSASPDDFIEGAKTDTQTHEESKNSFSVELEELQNIRKESNSRRDQPHICKTCNKSFADQYNLDKHLCVRK